MFVESVNKVKKLVLLEQNPLQMVWMMSSGRPKYAANDLRIAIDTLALSGITGGFTAGSFSWRCLSRVGYARDKHPFVYDK